MDELSEKNLTKIPGVIFAVMAAAKFAVFYNLIDISSGRFIIWLISCGVTAGLFMLFRNKWIPAVIYAFVSALMFADVTYYSFFSRYLSVAMLGAAGVLGDIGESIKEVLQPVYFVMLADALFLLIVLAVRRIPRSRGAKAANGRKLITWRGRISALLATYLLIAGVMLLSDFNDTALAIKNQELFCYHLSDIAENLTGKQARGSLDGFEDSYSHEKYGELFAAAEGRNLVFIQCESLMNFVINLEYNGQEVTPNLNRLIKDHSIYFDNYYQQVGSGNTSDAEFAANNSIYGTQLSYTYKLYGETNYFRGLPVLLKEQGYSTAVFHAYEDRSFWNREASYPQLGFDRYFGGLIGRDGDYQMVDWSGWGLADDHFLIQTAALIEENMQEPYYAFVNTLSNHHPFDAGRQYHFVDLTEEDEGTVAGNYLNSVAFTDHALGLFFDELKERGMYENSLFVIYGDHTGLAFSEQTNGVMGRILGRDYDYDTMLKVPLIIHMPSEERDITRTIHTSGGHLDIMPTVASLMGFDELDTIYFGHNLLTVEENLVPEQSFIKRGSFVFGDIMYQLPLDGVFENGRAWNVNTGRSVPLDGLKEYYLQAMEIMQTSEYILETDALRTIYVNGGSLSDTHGKKEEQEYPEELVVAGYPDPVHKLWNDVSSLDYSYDLDYRYLRMALNWEEDGLGAYGVDSYGERSITHEELIEWLCSHEDAIIVVEIDGKHVHNLDNTLTFFQLQGEDGEKAASQLMLIAENTGEVSGRYNVFLDVSELEESNETLLNFISENQVWAIIMSAEDMQGKRSELLEADCGIYIKHDDGAYTYYGRPLKEEKPFIDEDNDLSKVSDTIYGRMKEKLGM